MESIVLSNTATLLLTLAALITCVISWFIENKTVSAILSVASFACVLAVVVYALLLGAPLTEILIVVLLFGFLSLFAFIPDNKQSVTVTPGDTKESEDNIESCNELGTSDPDKDNSDAEHAEN